MSDKIAGLAISATLMAFLASPVQADPLFAPSANDIVGVGSDTTQYVLNRMTDGYNDSWPDDLAVSFDAVNPATGAVHDRVVIKSGVVIIRPNGSTEGINQLLGNPAVDYARVSRGPRAEDQGLLFLPFATDGLRYATAQFSSVPDGLTVAQLRAIYLCGNPALKPLVPNSGSGLRAVFLERIGLTESDIAGKPCLGEVQTNDPTPVARDSTALLPFSTARFTPGKDIKLNTTGFFVEHKVYNVVRYDDATEGVPAALQPFFGDGTPGSGWICGAEAQVIRAANGFLPTHSCGEAEFFQGGRGSPPVSGHEPSPAGDPATAALRDDKVRAAIDELGGYDLEPADAIEPLD